jgi:hypothetical protein
VRDVMRMAVTKSFDNLQKQFPGIGFSKIAYLIQSIEQLPSTAETTMMKKLLRNQENVGLIFKCFVKFDAGGMV